MERKESTGDPALATQSLANQNETEEQPENSPNTETREMRRVPEFIRVQLKLILNSKKLVDYDFPEDLEMRVKAIVDNLIQNMSYGAVFQKVVRQIRSELDIYESQIMTIIRKIVTGQQADVTQLCNSGLEVLDKVKTVYGGLTGRAPPQADIDPERSNLFLDFVEHETIRFVSYAALFYYLKENKLPGIQTISYMLGCRSPLQGKSPSKIGWEVKDLYSLERRVQEDFKTKYPDESENLEMYLQSMSDGEDDDDGDYEDLKMELGEGEPLFSVRSVGGNRGSRVWMACSQQPTVPEDDHQKAAASCDISENEYLIGVLYMAFQLSELGLTAGIHGGFNFPERVAKFLAALHNCYLELDHVNGHLRRTFDRLKYELGDANAVVGAIKLKESLKRDPTNVVSFRVFDSSASELVDDGFN